MVHEQGDQDFNKVLFNLTQYQIHDGKDGYRRDGEGWFGGDNNRLAITTQSEGTVGQGVDSAEVQPLYSRTSAPYFNRQAGVRTIFNHRRRAPM